MAATVGVSVGRQGARLGAGQGAERVQGTGVLPFRVFRAEVVGLRLLSPHFLRVTLAGPDLADFADNGYDQRFKLILPLENASRGRGFEHFPADDDWYPSWRGLPPERKNPIRTYTVRAARPARRELDFDVVLHDTGTGTGTDTPSNGDRHGDGERGGPALRWANRARIGDELMLVGPNRRHPGPHGGVAWSPPPGARLLIGGDETAVPAIASIVARLPEDARGHALLEVPDPADALDELVPPAGVEVLWFFRGDARPGTLLGAAARGLVHRAPVAGAEPELPGDDTEILWDVDENAHAATGTECYTWLAGEAGMVADLRRYLIRDAGLPRAGVASMGYWKLGVSGA